MKVFIVGASGLVGSHCLRYLKKRNQSVLGSHLNYPTAETVFFNPNEGDPVEFFEKNSFFPDLIIHCGALTNVDYCEENEDESFRLTVKSTEKIVSYCSQNKVKLVYISTDYVFDGVSGPYAEDETTHPINIYGKHKLEAEKRVRALSDFLILRITNVYGEEERSKNFIANLVNIVTTGAEKIFNLPFDQFATPVYAGDIAKMIHLLIEDKKIGIYHLASTDFYNRYQLAKKVCSYFRPNPSLKLVPISTALLNQKAIRPLNGGLLNHKFAREYPYFEYTNIDKFILEKYKNGI